MNKNPTRTPMEQLWEQGIERALQEQTPQSDLAEDALTEVAGLQVKAGIRAGLWSATCGGTCTCGCTQMC